MTTGSTLGLMLRAAVQQRHRLWDLLTHPGRAVQTIRRARTVARLGSLPIDAFVAHVTGLEAARLAEIEAARRDLDASGLRQSIEARAREVFGDASPTAGLFQWRHAEATYLAVRILQPEVVIETGVASGVSTTLILAALAHNGKGHLYSFDLPDFGTAESPASGRPLSDRAIIPERLEAGWLVPAELRDRWTLTLGSSLETLPPVLASCGPVDLFLHDSLHTYEYMSAEFRLVWPSIRPGGAILSDDAHWNPAFEEFCREQDVLGRLLGGGRLGGARKPDLPTAPPERLPLVEVTVVSSNATLLRDCLASLFAVPADGYELLVRALWNGPGRDRGPLPLDLREQFPQVHWFQAAVSGYARSQDLLLEHTVGDYVFILNDDVLLLEGSIRPLVAFMEQPEQRRVGMVSPRLLNPNRTLQPNTFAYPSLFRVSIWASGLRSFIPFASYGEEMDWREGLVAHAARMLGAGNGRSRFWAHDRTLDVECFGGAAMFVRGTALRQVGGIDVVSLGGVEEIEWQARFHDAGWRVVFHPAAEVIHIGGVTQQANPAWRVEWTKGHLNFFRKHRPRLEYWGLRTIGAAAFGVSALAHAITVRPADARVRLACAAVLLRGG